MSRSNADSNRIGCAMRLANTPQTVTVVNCGHFSEKAPRGVHVTATEHFPLHNHAVFYLHNPGCEIQDLFMGTRDDQFFELWTIDGYKLAFDRAGKGGPNKAECPIHTDAKHIAIWEVLVFTKFLTDAPVPNKRVPENAVPYTIQTKDGCYLQSIPNRKDYNRQPVYKSLKAKEEASRVQFVELPEDLQRDCDSEFARIRAKPAKRELEESQMVQQNKNSVFCCFRSSGKK